jgi:hypothetical protein
MGHLLAIADAGGHQAALAKARIGPAQARQHWMKRGGNWLSPACARPYFRQEASREIQRNSDDPIR